jgi:DUF4097 and DUF4098 domain-containing protein YvlB
MKSPMLVAMLLVTLCTRAHAQSDVTQIPADGDAQVTITQSRGSLVVTASASRSVAVVSGTALARDVTLKGGGARVDVEISGDRAVELRVPRLAQLRILGGNSSVSVRNVTGTVDVESSGGIEIVGAPRSIHASGFSGQVVIKGGGTELTRAESIGGAVIISGARGIVDARSSTGMVDVIGDVREATLFSVAGRIRFVGSITTGGRISAETTSGAVELRLPKRTAAAFELSTVSADIRVEFERQHLKLSPPYPSRTKPGVRLGFTIGNGAGRVKVATVGGSITLDER